MQSYYLLADSTKFNVELIVGPVTGGALISFFLMVTIVVICCLIKHKNKVKLQRFTPW